MDKYMNNNFHVKELILLNSKNDIAAVSAKRQ